MALIDDEGNLLGVVNVVDALVVLLVAAVVVAGAALVLADDPAPEPDTGTTHATLDLGTQPDYVVAAINEGDVYEPSDGTRLTITDLHLTPREGGVAVLARVEVQGTLDDDGAITYENAPLRLGRSLEIATDRYQVNGQIRDVGEADAIDAEETTAVLRGTMPAAAAESIASGDELRLAGRTVATVEDSAVYATADPGTRRVLLAVSLDAHRHGDSLWFAGTPLRQGQNLTFPTTAYSFEGTVERVGGEPELDSATTREVTLRMEDVHEDMADAIAPGMVEYSGEETVAEVTDVETEPSIIIATGDDGTVNVVDHPVNREVTITADLRVRETTTGVRFKGEPLRQGSTVVLDLGTVTVEATVVAVGA
ncbi:DUF4330 family protein [Halopenitus salinus]|uniref:DUF4330 family protein n=1 Tax=Halopenitus salinus TaxID=1198295 RepID=A0ABD5URY9_9EURY